MIRKNYVHKHYFEINDEKIEKTLKYYNFFKSIRKVVKEMNITKYQVYCLLIAGNYQFGLRGREKIGNLE